MKKLAVYYSFILVSIMMFSSFLRANTTAELISAVIFYPLFAYFIGQVFPEQKRAIAVMPVILPIKKPAVKKKHTEDGSAGEAAESGQVLEDGMDNDRRAFLKIIASAGAGLFMMSIFTKKTHAAFFGSMPGPGTIAVKDSTGAVIDPAIKTPTDGYKITEIDDSGSPSYYGFVNKDGAWFIMKEDTTTSPNYSYAKGDSGFASNWLIKGTLSYGYFDTVF